MSDTQSDAEARAGQAGAESESASFVAYELWPNPGFVLEPAPARRQWMDEFPHRVPYRCLPINMANQAGWFVRTPVGFSVTWNGKHDLDGLKIEFLEKLPPEREQTLRRHIKSNFGGGIVTFAFPWLFRTPKGIGLWVRGPSNRVYYNARPIEGLVETDWAHAPFTMNWRIEKRNSAAYFRANDPVCMLTPYPLDLLESLEPRIRPISEDPQLHEQFQAAARERNETVRRAIEGMKQGFELNYMKGNTRDESSTWDGHRTNLKLRSFGRDSRGSN